MNTSLASDHTLVIEATSSGFFSNFNRVVNHLHHSLGHDGCRAVRVDWRADGEDPRAFAYGTPADGNTWEHFFEPLDFPNAPPQERMTTDYADFSMTGRGAYRMYKAGNGWRGEYHRAFRDHIRLTPRITTKLERICEPSWVHHMPQQGLSIGVHYRHPHHDREAPRPSPPAATYARWAQSLLPADSPGKVLLATDVQEAVEVFHDTLGERLVVADATRAGLWDQTAVHHAPLDPRLSLGEEVLIDALLLARCDLLLHGTSNVATAVGYINPDMRMVYCEPVIAGLASTARARASARLNTRFPAAHEARRLARRVTINVGKAAELGWLAAQRARR
jgi:hypothetical protein